MKPTEQQDILLRKYLRDTMRYRETYEEVYDHVITALESNVYNGTLEEAVNQILRVDFGGYDQLRRMEAEAKTIAINDAISRFLQFVWSYFKGMRLLYTAVFAVLVYFTLAQIKLQPLGFGAIFALVILTPGILSLRRYYVVGYLFRDVKKSIRDDVFGRIAMVPTRLFVFMGLGIIIAMDKGHNIWQNATPAVLTVLYALSAIYLLSLVRLYRDEFKISIQS
ncbi:MAG: hypothetical protein V4592_20100 [Bacteroidota bacterium]